MPWSAGIIGCLMRGRPKATLWWRVRQALFSSREARQNSSLLRLELDARHGQLG